MRKYQQESISAFVDQRNRHRQLFTAGPASLLAENLTGLRPCFGRGDAAYMTAEENVMTHLSRLSGHTHLIRMQGSACLALEIVTRNFLTGRILVIETGFYSSRLTTMARNAMSQPGEVRSVETIAWSELDSVDGAFDWVMACSTETSTGYKLPIDALRHASDRLGAQLMLDATASIGLENNHELADVIAYSSCKGLFGLTGAAFIASHKLPSHSVDSFYLSYENHREKRMTGPYHAILSLADVLPRHKEFREAVVINKNVFMRKMHNWLPVAHEYQPLLCTRVNRKITTSNPAAVLYVSRYPIEGSIVCHLGEVHLGLGAKGEILDALEFSA